MVGTRSRLAVAFAITVVVLMAVQSISVGFATSSYAATTIVSNNTVSTEHAILGYYTSSDGINYSPVSENVFSHGCVEYTESGNGNNKIYKIKSTTVFVNIPNLYLKIEGNGTYSLSKSVVTSDGNVAVDTFTMYLNNIEASDGYEIQPNVSNSVKLKCVVNDYSSRTMPSMPTLQVSLTAQSLYSAVVVDAGNSFDFMSISQQAVDDLADQNGAYVHGNDTNPSYTDPGSGETFYLVPDNDTDEGVAGIYITAGDKTYNINSSNNDTFNTTINIPNDKQYIIKISVSVAGLTQGSIKVTLTEGSTSYPSDELSITIYGNQETYLYKSGNKLEPTTDYSSHWMQETTSALSLTVQGSAGTFIFGNADIQLELLFKESV